MACASIREYILLVNIEPVIGTLESERILHHLEILSRQKITYDTRLSDVCYDSLDLQDFMIGVEDFFDVVITMNEAVELKTMSELVELVEKKMKAK